jgi:hypothetical protein
MKFVSLFLAISILTSGAFATTNKKKQQDKALVAKQSIALKMAEMSRCDKKLRLYVFESLTDAEGNVIIVLAESSDGRNGGDFGVEYLRSVHFNKTNTDHAKANEILLTGCEK